MVARKKSKLGVDPLAWLKEGEVDEAMMDNGAAEGEGVLPDDTIALLSSSFDLLAPQSAQLVQQFYATLFQRYPQVKPLFAGTDIKKQEKKLLQALKVVVQNLKHPHELVEILQNLGRQHAHYGAEPAHYPAVAEVLLEVMADLAGEHWNDELHNAWSEALNLVATTMIDAQNAVQDKTEDKTMVARKSDVSESISKQESQKLQLAEYEGKMAAINKTQAVIEFNMDGSIITANDNFLKVMGYTLDEIRGEHHSIFVPQDFKESHEYREFWAKLNRGEFEQKEYMRLGKGGKEIWISASYNPILDLAGKPFKVVKFAADITEARRRAEIGTQLQGTVDGSMTAMMMVNRDFDITYVNKATMDLLTKHEDKMRTVFPGFRAAQIIGTNIDTFHKNPAHQRQLLSDPRNLPYKTDISVADLKFSLNVTAILDGSGKLVGNALEWSDVTDARRRELAVARLQSAVDGAQTNLMLCDENLNITYCNPAVLEMMGARQHELRKVWHGFDVNKLVGTCIDIFHKNPAHQRALLKDASRLPTKAEIKVADLEFEVNATMITGPEGEYMGNMVEWKDITEQKDAERQIQGMIESAVVGDLSNRIRTEQYDGFLKGLGDGINQLMDAVVVPIQETKRVISGLSDGDLTQSITGSFEGEFAELRDAVNATMTKLLSMVSEIRTSSASITSAANEISQGTADLSQRTEEQASSLEETAASMEELTGTVRQNADNARQANQLATSAREEAGKGGEVVGKAIEAMSAINSASKKIADIIGVIDEIAFQTNLLALNAAVEAARAGEQGRGFAVVAAEVRNLAQRSASAAKEIKSLINDSVDKVDEGSKLVDQSGESLMEIVNSVKKVSDIVAEIASASQEQASGIDQVNKAVTQMDEMTQQNAALVEEAAASSQAMTDQAQSMDELMNFFNVGEHQSAVPHVQSRQAQVKPRTASAPVKKSAARPAPVRPAPTSRSKPQQADSEWEEF